MSMQGFQPLRSWLRSHQVELALSVRVTTAALASLVIALALQLKLPLWAVLTSIIVTQLSVGRSLKTTRDYLIGTLGGAVYGGAVAILLPHSGEGALLVVLVVAVAPLAFVAALKPAYNAATVTAIIVLLLPMMNRGTTLESAIDRVFEVAVGAMTGLAVSVLVVPSRAQDQARAGIAEALDMMASTLSALLRGLAHGRDAQELHRLQDGIGHTLSALNAIAAEAERERALRLSAAPETAPLLRTALRLRHDLVMIGRASIEALPDNIFALVAKPLGNLEQALCAHLRGAAAALRKRAPPPQAPMVETALADYAAAVTAVREGGLTRALPADVVERFFALGFSLEQMRQNMDDLDRRIADWAAVPAPRTGGGPE
jgi:uncharacterized membrane protein YccC